MKSVFRLLSEKIDNLLFAGSVFFVISRIRKTVAVCKFMKGVIMSLVDEIPSERNFPPSDTN